MLKRVAVVGKDKVLAEALSAKNKAKDLEVVTAKPGSLPPATAAVALSAEDVAAGLKGAIALGARHEAVLSLLAQSLDAREDFKPGSSERVKEHATRFAKALNLDAEDQLKLERAALLRDIGKMTVPTKVLLKDSLLTYDDWDQLRRHTHAGGDILEKTGGFEDIAEIVRRHHCCYDGTGYPDGLEGEQIPRLGRALKVLDVFCAMTSPRHYRKGQSTAGEAVAHLKEERGKHFDPELVDLFIEAAVGQEE